MELVITEVERRVDRLERLKVDEPRLEKSLCLLLQIAIYLTLYELAKKFVTKKFASKK